MAPAPPRSLLPRVVGGVGAFLAFDAAIRAAMSVTGLTAYMPTQIGSMLGAFAGLSGASLAAPAAAGTLYASLMPALGWVTRWLPVFLVPVQVMLPTISLPGGAADVATLLAFLTGGWLGTLVISARLSRAMLGALPNTLAAASVGPGMVQAPLRAGVPLAWLLLAAVLAPIGLGGLEVGEDSPRIARSGCLAALGAASYALGLLRGFPGHISMLLCGASTIGGAAAFAAARGETYSAVVRRDYLTRDQSALGSGDLALGFLGPALVATGVQMFQYRARIQAFGPVLLGTCAVMSLVNILSTVALAPMLGISPDMTLAATVRCVTIPMALPTYAMLCEADGREGNIAFVALCAGLTGFLGFAASRMVLSSALCGSLEAAFPRGVATGAAAHVLGAATFASIEPEAFAWAMLGMAASGVFSSAWICSCPPVRDFVVQLACRKAGDRGEGAG